MNRPSAKISMFFMILLRCKPHKDLSFRDVIGLLVRRAFSFEKQVITMRTLLVEDNSIIGQNLAEVLEVGGLEPTWVQDGRQAVNWLLMNMPQVILLDMHLPYISGVEIISFVRATASLRSIYLIVVTADARLAEKIRNDVDLVLIKPVSYGDVMTLVDRLTS